MLSNGCKKSASPSHVSVNGTAKDGFPNQPFNWETSTVMMPSLPAGPDNPSLPWTSQSGSYIDPAIISDYKSADGWVLVYNTFNPTYYTANAASGGLYFALYNKYRGLLRYYLYVPSGQFGGGANIQHGLSVFTGNGSTTSMLNFEGSDIVDPSVNNPSFTKTNNVGVAQQGGWYAMQYEIAYDPTFASASYPNLGIAWNSRTISISDIKLNGTESGAITGDITQNSNSGLGTTILNGVLGAAEVVGAVYTGGASTGVIAGLTSAAAGGLAGNTTAFFSGVFGGNSNNPQTVDLKMNDSITLVGTINTPNALAPNSFVFPGETIATGNNSYPPLYNSPLGVFNLSARPTINYHVTGPIIDGQPAQGRYNYHNSITFSYDATLASILQINPAVSQNATIQIANTQLFIKPTLVALPNNIHGGTVGGYEGNIGTSNGTKVKIGTQNGYMGVTTCTQTWFHQSGGSVATSYSGIVYLQVTVLITPNNGAPASRIVKTFATTLVKS